MNSALMKNTDDSIGSCLGFLVWLGRSFLATAFATCLFTDVVAQECKGKVYLTFDVGDMSNADGIAAILSKQAIKATFFLLSEKTFDGGWALDDHWADYWRERLAEGHAFGTLTYDQVRVVPGPDISVKATYGEAAGRNLKWSAMQYCDELRRVDFRFRKMTGQPLDALWRAPGGKTSPASRAAGEWCGYGPHAGWSSKGLLGDELSTARYSDRKLIDLALKNTRNGDVLMAHLGSGLRKDSMLPVVDAVVVALKERGMCFVTMREHPDHPQ
jgi:peptidoglycan/xylan/chitin deacetylase (PgdA/CDA1 family)